MKSTWPILVTVAILLVLLAGGYWWLSQNTLDNKETPARPPSAAATRSAEIPATPPTLRLGLIPEQNVFELRQRYQALANYLADKLHQPVELATVNSYRAILNDFSEKQIDAAFLGSLVAVLAMDRLDAKVLLKTAMADGDPTYHGVVFVREDSPIKSVADFAGRSIGLVRTTTGGNLFPIYLMLQEGVLNGSNPPKLMWIGSHDEVVLDVAEGHLDIGAVKNTWLDRYDRSNAQPRMRRLAESKTVPNNALVIRADLAQSLGPRLQLILLNMEKDQRGREALAAFGAQRFLVCQAQEYETIYAIVAKLGPDWNRLGIPGPPPKRPRNLTADERK